MTTATVNGPIAPSELSAVLLRPIGIDGVTIGSGLWAERLRVNAEVNIPLGWDRLHSAGNVQNFERAAGGRTGEALGEIFADSDVYKWLEAAAWEYGRTGDRTLLTQQRELTAIVAAAQQPDGYINAVAQLRGMPRYSALDWSHEIYCAGHLMQAAVAQRRATGDTALLDVAVKLADHLVDTFGPNRSRALDGHPIAETALVELYRETDTRAYLDLARWFVDARGHGTISAYGRDPIYFSDRVPVREALSPEGHAVRAVYLAAGAADVAAEDGDYPLRDQLAVQFDGMISAKQYLTGGLGARWDGESFGDPFELPTDRAYAESCAAIGGLQWAQRMLLATGDERYADQVELMLLNGVLPGVSLAGGKYFYVNTLQVREDAIPDDERNPANGRLGWFGTACCPPNIMRTLSSLAAYVATTTDDGVQLHQYVNGTVRGGGLELSIETDYPHDSHIRVVVRAAPDRELAIGLRIPSWATDATANGRSVEPGLLTLRRRWSEGDAVDLVLPHEPRVITADDRIDAVRGTAAVAVGPLIYAFEQVDQPDGASLDDVRLDPNAPITLGHVIPGVGHRSVRVSGHLQARPRRSEPYGTAAPASAGQDVELIAIPYFSWANRELGAMRVWIPKV